MHVSTYVAGPSILAGGVAAVINVDIAVSPRPPQNTLTMVIVNQVLRGITICDKPEGLGVDKSTWIRATSCLKAIFQVNPANSKYFGYT